LQKRTGSCSSARWHTAAAPAAIRPATAEARSPAGELTAGTPLAELRAHLQLHNTMARGKQPFTPRAGMEDKVQMYVCGVTVYDYSHIGRQ
jgi:cysteinyl-tRNA synthetase